MRPRSDASSTSPNRPTRIRFPPFSSTARPSRRGARTTIPWSWRRLAGIREWASKHAGRVARIAGGFHVVTNTDPEPWKVPISVETIEAAWRVGWYLVDHALAAHDLMGADEALDGARHVLRWIVKNRKGTFTKRDAFNTLRGRFKTVANLDPALALLVSHEYLRERPEPARAGAGRRASPSYEVNPYAHNTQNPQNADRAARHCRDCRAALPSGWGLIRCLRCGRETRFQPVHLAREEGEGHERQTAEGCRSAERRSSDPAR